MDVGSVAGTSVAIAEPSQVSRISPVDAVDTDLPASQAVSQPARTAEAGLDPRPASDTAVNVERRLVVDPETHILLSQVRDDRTDDLLSQVPDQAMLRMKTYAREVVAEMDERRTRGRVKRDL